MVAGKEPLLKMAMIWLSMDKKLKFSRKENPPKSVGEPLELMLFVRVPENSWKKRLARIISPEVPRKSS